MSVLDGLKINYHLSDEDNKLIIEIEKKLSLITIASELKRINLLTKARVRSIHSSLSIEANELSIDSVTDIINNRPVEGRIDDIQEVKNAWELYQNMFQYNYQSESDFLQAHMIMMKTFNDDYGGYRRHGEGIKKGNQIIYMAPESILVPSLMRDLFAFVSNSDIHPLVLAAIFHYYLVYIHPFSDGNGRMARFWVSLILVHYNIKFEFVPFEEEIYKHQDEYYQAIDACHNNGNANMFINYMLRMIDKSLEKIIGSEL